jgi:hypothetical protein
MTAKHYVPDISTHRAACGADVNTARDTYAISIYSAKCHACESAVRRVRQEWKDSFRATHDQRAR